MGIQINGQTDTVTAADGSLNLGGNVTIPGVLTYEDVTSVDSVGIITARSGLNVTSGSVGIGTDNPSAPLHILSSEDRGILIESTDANAYIVFKDTDTSSDFANRVGTISDGLYFNTGGGGERLRIDSSGNYKFRTGSGGTLTLGIANAVGTQIQRLLYDDSDGSLSIGGGTATGYPLKFFTGNDERLRISSSGNVGIGTDNPQSKLHIGNPVHDVVNDVDTTNTSLIIKQSTNTRDDGIYIERGGERKGYYMWINPGGGAGDGLTFSRNNSGTYSNTLILDREANAHFGGNAVFANGNGIDFSATSDASGKTSELLDDYEEGTFTPVLGGQTTPGTTANGIGRYTKIGNTVFITIRFSNVTISGGSGQIKITGLPFTPNSGSSNTPVANTQVYKVTMNTGVIYNFYATANGLFGLVSRNGTTWADWNYSDWTATGIYVNMSVTYDT